MASYEGKRAVITGGTTGMGRGIAEALLAGGAEVIVTGRNEQNLNEARRALGPRAHVVKSDAGSAGDIDSLQRFAREQFGALDAVFISAGYAKMSLHDQVSEAEYDHTYAINTRGPYFTVQRLAPLVRDGGAFVFITSIGNVVGYPGMSVYSGTKAALRSYAQSFAAELLPRGIRVNAISPGFIKTPTMGVDASDEVRAAFIAEGERATPMGRIGTVEEVAKAALFFAFDATFTTGAELVLDGGMTQLHLPNG